MEVDITVQELIDEYEDAIVKMVRKYYFSHNHTIKEEDKKELYARANCLQGFMWDILNKFDGVVVHRTLEITPTKEDIQQFGEYYTFEEGSKYKCNLLAVLSYRGRRFPLYDDDYGQSVFSVYGRDIDGDHIISSSAFNFFYAFEIAYQLDAILNKELINQEIKNLQERDF